MKKGNDDNFKKDRTDLSKSVHRAVLLKEVIDNLSMKKGDIVLDATVGGAGVTRAIADRFGKSVQIIGLDADAEAISRAKKIISGRVNFFNFNFRNLDKALLEAGVKKVNQVIFDLGLSSDQLLQSGRGFSFQKDEPLLMTFSDKPAKGALTAEGIVNHWREENIALIIKSYGEERFARRIAKAIVSARPVKTSKQLALIIKMAVPAKERYRKIHPATKTFQAIRMTVNDELNALKEGLAKAWEYLDKRGHLAVISFHSLEDGMVKRFMRQKAASGEGRILTKKPIYPSQEEILENPRSRSAKLRVLEKNE